MQVNYNIIQKEMSNFMPDTMQRKALEKVYARVFDIANAQRGKLPELTLDGKLLV